MGNNFLIEKLNEAVSSSKMLQAQSREEFIASLSLKQRLLAAEKEPPLVQIFSHYVHNGDLILIAGDTGSGKSTFCFDLADRLTTGSEFLTHRNVEQKKILYLDFEMSNRALRHRYPIKERFNDNFFCPDLFTVLPVESLTDFNSIKQLILEVNPDLVVIDNLSALSMHSSHDTEIALQMMRDFKYFVQETSITLLIVHHITKVNYAASPDLNWIAGSKHLSNFSDSVIFIGKSSVAENRRYLLQLKSRHAMVQNDVLVYDIVNSDQGLSTKFIGYDNLKNHLPNRFSHSNDDSELQDLAIELCSSPISYSDAIRQYAKITGKSVENGKKKMGLLINKNLIIQNPDHKYILNLNEFPNHPLLNPEGLSDYTLIQDEETHPIQVDKTEGLTGTYLDFV